MWPSALGRSGRRGQRRRRARLPADSSVIPIDKFNAGRWTATFITVETIYGVSWSLLATFTLVSADSESLAVVMFALALVGIATNAVSTRTLPGATLMSTLPMALTVAIDLVFIGGTLNTLNWSLAAVTIGG